MGRAKRKADWRHVLPISVCLTARRWVQKQDIYIYIYPERHSSMEALYKFHINLFLNN